MFGCVLCVVKRHGIFFSLLPVVWFGFDFVRSFVHNSYDSSFYYTDHLWFFEFTFHFCQLYILNVVGVAVRFNTSAKAQQLLSCVSVCVFFFNFGRWILRRVRDQFKYIYLIFFWFYYFGLQIFGTWDFFFWHFVLDSLVFSVYL